jgi:hypothetical protein
MSPLNRAYRRSKFVGSAAAQDELAPASVAFVLRQTECEDEVVERRRESVS